MADTGFIRYPGVTVVTGTVVNSTNLISGSNGNSQINSSVAKLVFPVLNQTVLDSYIDSVAGQITGISFKVSAKGDTTGDGINLVFFDDSFFSPNDFQVIPNSSDFTTLEFGGENDTWGFTDEVKKKIVFDWDNLSLWSIQHSVTSSNFQTFLRGNDEDLVPSAKIYYVPLTKQVTGWKRFKTLDDSGGWTNGVNGTGTPDTNILLSGSTGELTSVNSPTLPYFILSNPEDFDIPSNAVIEGLEVKTVIRTALVQTIIGSQIWKIKVDTQPITESDITDPYLDIPTFGTDLAHDRIPRSFSTGSETNLFGLNLTPSDLPNLKIGVKCTDINTNPLYEAVGVFGSGEDETGTQRRPNPSIRVFYSIPEKPTKPLKKSLATATIEVKATQPVSQLVNLTSNLSPQGNTSSPVQGSLEESQEASSTAAQSTFSNPVDGADRDSETGLTDTDNAPLFTRRRFSPL